MAEAGGSPGCLWPNPNPTSRWLLETSKEETSLSGQPVPGLQHLHSNDSASTGAVSPDFPSNRICSGGQLSVQCYHEPFSLAGLDAKYLWSLRIKHLRACERT